MSLGRIGVDIKGELRARAKFWPVLALFPIITVGEFKAAGYTELAGVDTTILSLVFLTAVAGWYLFRTGWYPLRLVAPFLLVILVVSGASAFTEAGTYQNEKVLAFFLLTVPTALCVPIVCRSQSDLHGLLIVWLVSGLTMIVLIYTNPPVDELYGRLSVGGKTLGAAYLIAAAVVVAFAGLIDKLGAQLLSFVVLATGVPTLLGIASRGPLVAAVGGVIVWVLLSGKLRTRTILFIFLAVSSFALGYLLTAESSTQRLVFVDVTRAALRERAVDVFNANPLIGVGFGNFSLDPYLGAYKYPHNVFAEVAAETGVFGLSIVIACLSLAGIRVWRSRSDPVARAIGSVGVVMLIGQQFSSDITNRVFWVAVVAALLLRNPSVITLNSRPRPAETPNHVSVPAQPPTSWRVSGEGFDAR
jgi:O-antigen ligase